MLRTKKRKSTWSVLCKACCRPFPAPVERQTLEELTDSNAYQCPFCGETSPYERAEHTATA